MKSLLMITFGSLWFSVESTQSDRLCIARESRSMMPELILSSDGTRSIARSKPTITGWMGSVRSVRNGRGQREDFHDRNWPAATACNEHVLNPFHTWAHSMMCTDGVRCPNTVTCIFMWMTQLALEIHFYLIELFPLYHYHTFTIQQIYPLTVTLARVAQYEAIWLQWLFPKYQIDQSYSKIHLVTVMQYKPFAYSDTFVTLSKHVCNRVEFALYWSSS